jgi:hypothetical protein
MAAETRSDCPRARVPLIARVSRRESDPNPQIKRTDGARPSASTELISSENRTR